MFEALSNKITVGGDTQGGVMMEPQPTSALVMGKTELLLELLVQLVLPQLNLLFLQFAFQEALQCQHQFLVLLLLQILE